tara:strand:- start:700 stop:858 length:159 start_codon:yes stop_codon:yes gene_type:complete
MPAAIAMGVATAVIAGNDIAIMNAVSAVIEHAVTVKMIVGFSVKLWLFFFLE